MNEYLVPCKKVLLLTKLTSMCKFRLVFVRYYRYRYLVPVQIATNCSTSSKTAQKCAQCAPSKKPLPIFRVRGTACYFSHDQQYHFGPAFVPYQFHFISNHTWIRPISFQITPGSDHITSALLLH